MIGDELQQFWVQLSLNKMAVNRALEAIQNAGKSLPCEVTAIDGAIVTVKFNLDTAPWTLPPISIPKLESPWMRSPTQIGDMGLAVPAGTYLGGISGLGGGVADMRNPGNLSALYFVPISSAGSPPPNVNAATMQGPEGFVCQTTQGSTPCSIIGDQNGITMTYGGHVVTLDANGFTIDGILFDTHVHGGVATGSNDTLGPL
ncbi:MAG: hypothetical protein ACYCY2_06505 [Acidithiobacillus ferriphilus]